MNEASHNFAGSAYWMPFTANRAYRAAPREIVSASGMVYRTTDGREVLDGCSGLWCVNAGHCREPISNAISDMSASLDYAPAFQFGHPSAFRFADRLADLMPGDLNHIFFTNSGSEAVDTALKIALAHHAARGEGRRVRLIGRERGYHGVNFGGLSVGGIVANRRAFGPLLPNVDHLPHTYDVQQMAFSRGQPGWGAHLADELERLVALHGADTIAAVIIEPVACSAGILVPPVGYLERIREITARYGILLIFDEVITAFGRLGAGTAAERFGVVPDLITMAKGMTNGAVPMGAVAVSAMVYDAFMHGPEHLIELFHGYTYSGHPLGCAAGLAALDLYEREGLFDRSRSLEHVLEQAVHELRARPGVRDVRNMGMAAAVELEPSSAGPTLRTAQVMKRCFANGLLVRATGEVVALAPPLIASKKHIERMTEVLGAAIAAEA